MTRLDLMKFFLTAPLIWMAQLSTFAQGDMLHQSKQPEVSFARTLGASTPNGRRFYLTRTKITRTAAVNACKSGFHAASLGELFDVRSLQYDDVLGMKGDERGSAPTSDSGSRVLGWIRDDFGARSDNLPSQITNCSAEEAPSGRKVGAAAYLARTVPTGSLTVTAFSTPWRYVFTRIDVACNVPQRVWCIQDQADAPEK